MHLPSPDDPGRHYCPHRHGHFGQNGNHDLALPLAPEPAGLAEMALQLSVESPT